MSTVLHITTDGAWREALAAGRYETPSLAAEGFVHGSDPDQVLLVANGIFRGRSGLVLLAIDTDRLAAEVRYENCEGGERLFPHVYGPIELEAVTAVVPFPPGADGLFELPPELRPA